MTKYYVKNKKSLISLFSKSLISFGFSVSKVNRWIFHILTRNYHLRNELVASIYEIKSRIKIEKNIPQVDKKNGWSPFDIINFLKRNDINMSYYQSSVDDQWFSCSSFIELESTHFIKNNISFYIEGSSLIANKLTLSLNVNDIKNEATAIDSCIDYLDILSQFATGHRVSGFLKKDIRINQKINFSFYLLETVKEYQKNQIGYNLRIVITLI